MPAEAQLQFPMSLGAQSVSEILVALERERRSGTLTVHTKRGVAEAYFVEGRVTDLVFGPHESMKAAARLVDEREGTLQFVPGTSAALARLRGTTHALVLEAEELASQAEGLRSRAGPLASSALLTVEGTLPEHLELVDRHVLERFRAPTVLDVALDDLPQADAVIISSVLRMHAAGLLRSLGAVEARVQLCGPDQLHLVRASAARAQSLGFSGPARIVFAASSSRLAVFSHTVLSLADAAPPDEPMPTLPVPFTIAVIQLGDGVELEVVALPLVPAYAPLWAMALGGTAAVVKLDDAAAVLLEDTCASVGAPVVDARAIFGVLEETSAVQVASLIKTALDADGMST